MRLIGEAELAACGIGEGTRILAGLSGGADSVALLYELCRLRGSGRIAEVYAAHLNHGIRGAQADADAAFCEALCKARGITFVSRRVDVPAYARENGLSLETAARTLRYAFLREQCAVLPTDCIALAHHADDQAETVLLHMLRGSGTAGLSGMRMKSGDLVRPLLHVTRGAIETYLSQLSQDYCTDETNAQLDAARNRVRHALLPALETYNPRVREALCRLAEASAADEDYLSALAGKAAADAALPGGGYDRDALAALPPPVRGRVLLSLLRETLDYDVSAADVRRLSALLYAQNGCCIELRGGHAAWVENGALCIGTSRRPASFETPFVRGGETLVPGGRLLAAAVRTFTRPADAYSVCADAGKLPLNTAVRTRREGDCIFPLGGPGRKSLSDYLIDRKCPRSKRDMPLLCDGSEVLWVVGGALSERLRVNEKTKNIISISFEEDREHGPYDGRY